MTSSSAVNKDILIAVGGALAALAWRELFGWWARGPAQQVYELVMRHLSVNDVMLVMGTDVLFAIGCGLLYAEIFIRLVRPSQYQSEAIVIAAFMLALLTAGQVGGEGAVFLLRLPPLWLTLMCFGVRVGYGIKAERKRHAAL